MPLGGILKRYAEFCLIALLLTLALMLSPVPVAALTLDQKQELDGFGVTIGVGDHNGQEFTPALTPLSAVAVNLDISNNGPCTVQASILQGTALHDLSGAVLGSPVSKAVSVGGWVEFDFSPISLTPGQRYAIQIIVTSGGNPTWWFADNAPNPGPYPNGNSITFGVPALTADMMFRTYSGPPQISPSSTSGTPGTMVTVTGSGFTVTAQPYCDFISNPPGLVGPLQGTDFVCNVAGDGSIGAAWFVVAAGASGSYSVTVSYFGQESDPVQFTVSQPQRPSTPVGGVVTPANKLAVFAPYLALFGVIGAVAIIVWKRSDN
jgi:hypothetical protein